ncbi:MAG TPA: polyprenyl diphosphate synthase [Thermomicrobiales bacterium]
MVASLAGDAGEDAELANAVAQLPAAVIPRHVAIIMDGNGRWAARRGLPRVVGHERGTDNIRRITFTAGEIGIRYLTLWAFSTENWRRPAEEIEGIMRILGEAIERETEELHRQGAQLRHIGSLEGLAPELRQSVLDAIDLTKDNDRLILTLAFNYGGRQELIQAVRDIVAAGIPAEDVDERTIAAHLYTHDMPDPDLIIRTSGEYRMSNFLLWQAAYAELHFSPVLWPDFGPDELREAVLDYSRRERRFGHVSAAAAAGRN